MVVDQRYLIQQGTGRASPWKRPREPIHLAASADTRPAAPPAELQVLSLSEVPLPRLPYRTFDGQTSQVFEPGSGKLVLLNLWAGWCQPCLIELNEMVQRQDELHAAGVEVVALSVSQLDPHDSAVADNDVLRKMDFPFRSGLADAGLVQKLQLVNNHLFDLHLPLPVPTSVLVDGQGRLAALYKGRVSVDRVLRDARLIGLAVADRRADSVPFPGRWQEPLNSVSMIPLLDDLINEGFLAEADDYVRRLPAARKERLLPALVRLGMEFYRRGDGAKAQEHFAVAVKIDPTFVGVETALAVQREREGRPESAVKLYREALRRNPQSVTALNNLAFLLATHRDAALRDGAEAVRLAEQAARLTEHSDPAILDTLSAAYAELGDVLTAQKVGRDALRMAKAQGRLELAGQVTARLATLEK
jgi:tetratricopeptide (TPR) repeat protein